MANICNFEGVIQGKADEVDKFIKLMTEEDYDNPHFSRINEFEIDSEEEIEDEISYKKVTFYGECNWSLAQALQMDHDVDNQVFLDDFVEENPSLELLMFSTEDGYEFSETIMLIEGDLTDDSYEYREYFLYELEYDEDDEDSIDEAEEAFENMLDEFASLDEINAQYGTKVTNFKEFKETFKYADSLVISDNPDLKISTSSADFDLKYDEIFNFESYKERVL